MKLDLAQLRYRAASKMSMCSGQHAIHRSDDGGEVWLECDKRELDRMTVDAQAERGLDVSDRISRFARDVMFDHEQDVVSAVVIELLNRLEQLEQPTKIPGAIHVNMGPTPTYEQGYTAGLSDGFAQGRGGRR